MATEVAKKEDDNAKVQKNLDNWEFPKIPVHKIYKKQPFTFFPKCTIKDSVWPIEVIPDGKYTSLNLLPRGVVRRFCKKKYKFIHLGLVQVAINPLVRDGLDAPITVCLRDGRQSNDFKGSWLAVVETNMSRGPFYFNCFPGFLVSLPDYVASCETLLNLRIKSTGSPLAYKVRVVYKVMVDLSPKYLEEPVLRKTVYYHAISSTSATTVWDEVELEDDEELAQKKWIEQYNRLFSMSVSSGRP